MVSAASGGTVDRCAPAGAAAFRALGTEVRCALPGRDDEALRAHAARVQAHFEAVERRFSRFLADSELSRLNGADGAVTVSPELFDALQTAKRCFEWSEGLFDPLVGGALLDAGYDASFERLGHGASPRSPRHPRVTARSLALDVATRTVRRPPGGCIDLAGLVKGRAVDEASALLPAPALVEAGGDARLRGPGPEGGFWLVDVESPLDADRVVVTLAVREGGVATSAPNRRCWRHEGRWAHHLVDPRTQAPVESDLAQVTVVADTAEEADVLAKVAFLLGRSAGAALLDARPGVFGLLLGVAGDATVAGGREVFRA